MSSERVMEIGESSRSGEVVRQSPESTKLENYRDRAFSKWEEQGWVEVKGQGEDRKLVINETEFLTSGNAKKLMESTSMAMLRDQEWGGKAWKCLYWLFEGVQVEYKGAAKNMFYVPESGEAAFDRVAIGQAADKSIMGIWSVMGKGADRGDLYPTEQDLSSGVDFKQAAIAAEIYGFGKGYRGVDGRLRVQKEGQPVIVTGDWLKKSVGFKELENGSSLDRPAEAVELGMPQLTEAGLLSPDDFWTRNWDKNEVSTNGQLWLANSDGLSRRYTVGRGWEGAKAYRLQGGKYGLIKDGNLLLVDVDEIVREGTRVRAYEGSSKMVDVKKGMFRQIDAKELVVWTNLQGVQEKMSYGELIPQLIDFRQEFDQQYGGEVDFAAMPIGQQAEIMYLAKEVVAGGENGEVVMGLVSKYVETVAKMESWLDGLLAGMETKNSRDDRLLIFFNRVATAYRLKSAELLVGTLKDNTPEADEKLEAGHKLMESLSAVFEGRWSLQQEEYNRFNRGSNQVDSVTLAFAQADEVLLITIRPQPVWKERSNGQLDEQEASFRATYKDKLGNKLGLRLDLGSGGGEYKTSLDLDLLKQFGIDHHAQASFEAGLSDKQIFAEVMLFMADRLGIDERLAKKGLSWSV